jgi:type II secretory pathway component PulF
LARWIPKLLKDNIKKKRIWTREEFLAMVCHHLLSMLDNVVTMEESVESFHTPEPKQQSERWLEKGKTKPFMA